MVARYTKHGMVAHPEKIKYMIMGTRQMLSRCEECALSLWLDDRQLEQTQEERLLGLAIDPSLSWSCYVTKLRKKFLSALLFWPALKNSCQLNIVSFYLMLVLNLFLSIVCLSQNHALSPTAHVRAKNRARDTLPYA